MLVAVSFRIYSTGKSRQLFTPVSSTVNGAKPLAPKRFVAVPLRQRSLLRSRVSVKPVRAPAQERWSGQL